jgi:glycosyltransferase involved in cell wall biosynthesis
MRLTAARLREVVLMTKAGCHSRPFAGAQCSAESVGRASPAFAGGLRNARLLGGRGGRSWHDAGGQSALPHSRSLESLALRHADQVTTICEGLRGDIASRGIPPERITVIPNAVDVSLFRLDTEPDAELRRSLGLDGATVVGFAGSFYGYEGLDLLIEAVRQMLPRHPQLRVLLVGGGPQEAI